MILYHTTEKRNLKSIKQKGLLRTGRGEIYFSDRLELAFLWKDLLSKEWGTKNWIILKTDLPSEDLEILRLPEYSGGSIKEIKYKKTDIEPDKIEIVK